MKNSKKPFVIFIVFILVSSFNTINKANEAGSINVDQLHSKIIRSDNDTLYVVNFFATWCRPCIQEMPFFVEEAKMVKGQKVKLMFVSLDGISEQEKVDAFVLRRGVPGEVYILDSGDPNVWINQIDKTWTGSMPATVFYKRGEKKLFHEGDFDQRTLDSTINLYK